MDIEQAFEEASTRDFLDEDELTQLEQLLEGIFRERANSEDDGDLSLESIVAIACRTFEAGRVYQASIEDVFPVPMDRQMVYQFLQFLSERAS